MNTSNWQLNPSHSGSLLRLKKMLPRLKGFNLIVLQHNQPLYRDGLITVMNTEVDSYLTLDAASFESFALLEQALLSTDSSIKLIHIINIESLPEKERGLAFKSLNYHREQIARRCLCILALWLPEPLVKQMTLEAADFWAWREQVFEFGLPVEAIPRWEADFKSLTGLESEKKKERIEALESYLKKQTPYTSLATADMLHELGNLYEKIGKPRKALESLNKALLLFKDLEEKHAWARVLRDISDIHFRQGNTDDSLNLLNQKILPCFIALDDLDEQAETLDRIADIFAQQGNYEESLRTRREKILPILDKTNHIKNKAVTMGKIADILQARGQLDDALNTVEETLPVYEKLGDVREKAISMGRIADILQARGQLDDALNIRQTEQLPVYEKLGDVRAIAVTEKKIADIQIARGELDTALHTLQTKCIPPMREIGAIAELAAFQGKVAEIFQVRGQLDDALNIRQTELLPVYEKLGDVRSKAVTMGQIADILQARGQLDDALNIRKNEELPVYEKLGDVQSLLMGRTKVAILLWQIDSKANIEEIQTLLNQAYQEAVSLQIPEAEQIKGIMEQIGL
ncbi:tetratricopeptide repeat protein [Leucothrix pacifica]|uniref:Uncharacterized protein n=1 Tax=Leucothrix pacifica TaxID=1247513 RepID=A0A317CNB5_9GAMM|nr:tetratricopeptide repeat protein [Leucothrix pacifica]PWQ99691.1 hypothetical protein DKW60_05285 [Leucothrix pacifica]